MLQNKQANNRTRLKENIQLHTTGIHSLPTLSEAGDIGKVALKIEPALDALEFKRTAIKVDVSIDDLKVYTGDYEIGGMIAKFFLKDTTLHLTLPGQPEYVLIPTAKHKFLIKGLDGFKVEFVESNGLVSEAMFNQPNGVFKAKRK